jgi:hypothetical protein
VRTTLGSKEFFDKYAWNFLTHICSAYIYTYICVLDFEATCDREPGKVEKEEVLAIPVVLLGTVNTDNSFRVPDSTSMFDL